MAGKNSLHPIPHPAKKPFVGNLLSIGSDSPVLDMWKIAQDLGGSKGRTMTMDLETGEVRLRSVNEEERRLCNLSS